MQIIFSGPLGSLSSFAVVDLLGGGGGEGAVHEECCINHYCSGLKNLPMFPQTRQAEKFRAGRYENHFIFCLFFIC